MKLPSTKEDMLERFRIFGEMFCACYELCDGDYPTDIEDFQIDYDDMCETLGLDPDAALMIEMTDEPKEVQFTGIEVSDHDMVMICFYNERYHASMPAIHTPVYTLKRINELLQRYHKEATRQLKLDFKEN